METTAAQVQVEKELLLKNGESLAVAAKTDSPVLRRIARQRPYKRWIAGVLMGGALVGATPFGKSYWQWSQAHESTDNAFIDGHILQVSARIAGHVQRVLVDDNQLVHAGDVLLELDPADYLAALDEAKGRLGAAKADLAAATSQVEEAKSHVAAAQAAVAQAQAEVVAKEAEAQRAADDLERYSKARESAVVSSTEWGAVVAQGRTTQAALNASKKAVMAAEAQVGQAQSAIISRRAQVDVCVAQIRTAQAVVAKAALNVEYSKVVAPADGRVTRKSVEPGNSLIAGQPLMAVVGTEIWVTANFKETQLTHMRVGQPAAVEVDAYPGLKLRGHVESIQQGAGARFSLLPPENATGNYVKVVQRVPVKIVLDEQPGGNGGGVGGEVLGPGMSVVPTVDVGN